MRCAERFSLCLNIALIMEILGGKMVVFEQLNSKVVIIQSTPNAQTNVAPIDD